MHETNTAPKAQEIRLESRIERSPYQPDAYDRTVDGVVELMGNIETTMRAVRGDWRANVGREELEKQAVPHVERINNGRALTGATPLVVKEISDQFLAGIVEPKWEQWMPKDGIDEGHIEAWEALKDEYPHLAPHLEEWYMYHSKLHELRRDTDLMTQVDEEWRGEKLAATRAAHEFIRLEYQREEYGEQMAVIRAGAAKTGRRLTPGEQNRLKELQRQMSDAEASVSLLGEANQEAYLAEVDRLTRLEDKRQLESGLLMTDQMKQVIKEAVPGLMAGKPALFVGETGGAKTALAEYISHQYFDAEPEFISAYGDVNSYQLMGKQELREQHGASVSEFMPGPVVRAMEQGRPLIFDEINAMPPEILKRLNKVMQLRPGDTFTIQEDSGREVTVRPGFCIIATANEKSKRYKGVDDLSVEFQNRFGANIYRVRYPDHDNSYLDAAIENERLAFAAVATERGEFPEDIDPDDFDSLVRAAFVSQQVFSGVHGEGYNDYISRERQVDRKPGLEETVIAPRTLVDLLRDVAGSYGEVSIKRACERFLDGIKNESDRKTIQLLLDNHGLLPRGVGE